MNPMTNIKNVQKLNERELELGMIGKKSWHDDYKDSAWIFIGGLPFDLSEGDVLCIFSQYGEIVNLNLVRDHKTGKSKGFGFLCYEDQRSTVLSVDNLNGIKILGRTIRVDHVKDYKVPKEHENDDEMIRKMREEGCAPTVEDSPPREDEEEKEGLGDMEDSERKRKKKKKKEDKKKKKEKNKSGSRHASPSSSDSERSDRRLKVMTEPKIKTEPVDVKKEKEDRGYDKGLNSASSSQNGWSSKQNRECEHQRRLSPGDFPRKANVRSESQRGDYSSEERRDRRDRDYSSKESSRKDESRRNRDGSRERERDIERRRDGERVDRERQRDGERDGRERRKDGERDNRERHRDSERDRRRERSRSREGDRRRERSRSREGDRDRKRDRYR